ncbi:MULTISPECIES: penicillin-insensitive murein endopeptidase [Mesorhizobium]|uniref:Penicillin-insensitive murein endopeptidase n=1 Tax=Mesorhizobium denitrificans TaxID=2294114 RepID=A0A371XK76_9HYPH|nr:MULTISPECIES: penicillin-insensitive murein endopeptidase [Mesorhizobium]RFC69630.1 penicillin-insensitive murein endopeptidase [Mesorhizobium denitrificans]
MSGPAQKGRLKRKAGWLLAVAIGFGVLAQSAQSDELAKNAFGAKSLPAASEPHSYGFYSKGCFSGGMAIAADGPTWQAMRLSRNRRWGHPTMIRLLEKLSHDAVQDGWPGLLIGDISQPRGGPMLTGHASHQIGLDADIWFTPMPDKRLSAAQRESVSAVSMIKKGGLTVDDRRWSDSRMRLLKRAASYPEVERILVHPGIKKKLCDTVTGDRTWLRKVRPFWGHDYHFHVRIGCQAGSVGCKEQAAPPEGDGCDKSLAWWFTDEPWRPNKNPDAPKARDIMKLSALPKACMAVLNAPSPASEAVVTLGGEGVPQTSVASAPAEAPTVDTTQPPAAANAYSATPTVDIPVPRPKAKVGQSSR